MTAPTRPAPRRRNAPTDKRFSELMGGRTAVIVSHRFSTVHMADCIVVLRDGQLVEEETHDALVALQGLYGELFQMQAEGYR